MKILLFIMLITCLSCKLAYSQKMPVDYFDEGTKYYQKKDYDSALKSFNYIVEKHPSNQLYPESLFNIGCIYYVKEEFDKAINIFRKILNSGFDDKEIVGGNIMSNPYANYTHNASNLISEIYFDKKMYDSALHYLILSDTLYKLVSWEANFYEENEKATAIRYSDIYIKLNKKDKAIQELLQNAFGIFASSEEVVNKLKELLIDQKDLKKRLDNSLNYMYSKERTYKDSITLTHQYILFLGTEMYIPKLTEYAFPPKEFNKENMLEEVHKSRFYKMITSLPQ